MQYSIDTKVHMYKNTGAGYSIAYYSIYPADRIYTANGGISAARGALWIWRPRLTGGTRRAEKSYLRGIVSYGLDII